MTTPAAAVPKQEDPFAALLKNVLSFCDPYAKSRGDGKRGVVVDVEDTASLEPEEADTFSLTSNPSPVSGGVPRSIITPNATATGEEDPGESEEATLDTGVKLGTQTDSPVKNEILVKDCTDETAVPATSANFSMPKAVAVLMLLLALIVAIGSGFANIQHHKELLGHMPVQAAGTPLVIETPPAPIVETPTIEDKSSMKLTRRRRGRRIGRVLKPLRERIGKVAQRVKNFGKMKK